MKFKIRGATCAPSYEFCYEIAVKYWWWPWYVSYDNIGFKSYEAVQDHMAMIKHLEE